MPLLAVLWLTASVWSYIAISPNNRWVAMSLSSAPIGWRILVSDPILPHTLYANIGNDAVGISADGGRNWRTLPFAPLFVEAIAVSIRPGRTLYVLTVTPGGEGPPQWQLHRTRDNGMTFTVQNIDQPISGTIQSLAVDSVNANMVYIGLDQCLGFCEGGVIRSSDGGQTWSATALQGFTILGLQTDPLFAGTAYAMASDSTGVRSLYRTMDSGDTWTKLQVDSIISLAIDPDASATIYALDDAGLLRSINRGSQWSLISSMVSGSISGDAIAVDPTNPLTLVYVSSVRAQALLSRDSGSTWVDISDGLSLRDVTLYDVLFTPDGSLFGRSFDRGVTAWLTITRHRAAAPK